MPPILQQPGTPPTVPQVPLLQTITPPVPPAPYTANTGTATPANAVGYDPAAFTVDKKQTVAGQIEDIQAKDSPLMQMAETRAAQKMNARGLLHSSLAVGEGQKALYETALPIAQQDATTHVAAHTNTQNAKNAALNFKAGAENDTSKLNAQLGTQTSMANAEMANKALAEAFQVQANYGLAGLDANVKTALANLDVQSKIALTTMENENRQLLQANQDAASMFNQTMQNIAAISQNATMSQQAKDDAVFSQLNSLREGLRQQGAIAGLDLGSYFNTGAPAGTPLTAGANAATNGSIPPGGWRLANGQVFNANGTPAGWNGPTGMPVGTPGGGTGGTGAGTGPGTGGLGVPAPPGSPGTPPSTGSPGAPPNRAPTRADLVVQHGWRYDQAGKRWVWMP